MDAGTNEYLYIYFTAGCMAFLSFFPKLEQNMETVSFPSHEERNGNGGGEVVKSSICVVVNGYCLRFIERRKTKDTSGLLFLIL